MATLDALYASDGLAPAAKATVSSTRLVGDMDLITDTVDNWPQKGIATSGIPDLYGTIVSEVCVFEYVLTGSIIHIVDFAPGYYDKGHEENQIVILKPTTYHTDSLVKAIEEVDDKHFTYDFINLSEVPVPHLLNKRPAVSVEDSAGDVVMGDVEYVDSNNLMVRFTSPFTGRIICN